MSFVERYKWLLVYFAIFYSRFWERHYQTFCCCCQMNGYPGAYTGCVKAHLFKLFGAWLPLTSLEHEESIENACEIAISQLSFSYDFSLCKIWLMGQSDFDCVYRIVTKKQTTAVVLHFFFTGVEKITCFGRSYCFKFFEILSVTLHFMQVSRLTRLYRLYKTLETCKLLT